MIVPNPASDPIAVAGRSQLSGNARAGMTRLDPRSRAGIALKRLQPVIEQFIEVEDVTCDLQPVTGTVNHFAELRVGARFL